jgi:hypothetical protein
MKLEQRLYRVGGGHGFKSPSKSILNKDKGEIKKSLVEKIKTLLKNKKKEKVYSEAFEDGVNYAIQKMFGKVMSKEDLKKLENDDGSTWGTLGFAGGGISAYQGGKHCAEKAAKEGKSDEEILRDATSGALASGAVTNAIHHLFWKGHTPLYIAHSVAGTAAGVHGARENAKEIIRRRKQIEDGER